MATPRYLYSGGSNTSPYATWVKGATALATIIAQGIFTSTFFGGSVVGLIVGARIISSYGWHYTFFSVFPVAIILAVIMAKLIRIPKVESSEQSHGIDIKGAIALSVTVILFLMGV